jgi:hypothetical protein
VAIKVHIQLGPEDGPWFAELLRSVGDAEITVTGPEQHVPEQHAEVLANTLQEATLSVLEQKASPAARQFMEQFISVEVTARHASDQLGRGKAGFVRLYVPGPRLLGAYAVVAVGGGYVNLRLPKEYAKNCHHAFARDVRDGDPYAVRVRLTSAEAVDEAQSLAAKAYELVEAYGRSQ